MGQNDTSKRKPLCSFNKFVNISNMRLDVWLKIQRITQTDFAKDIGVSRPYLSRVMNNNVMPSKSLAKLIELKTNGEVTADELLTETFEDTRKLEDDAQSDS